MGEPGAIVLIGASAGGVAALKVIASGLRPDFPAPVCIVQHVGPHGSILPEILRFHGPNAAVHAQDGQCLAAGTLYLAPPDHHMRVDGGRLRLDRGPKQNHARPSIDPLFRSAAAHWRERAIGVILTGRLGDGAAGLKAVQAWGGTTVVQDPREAAERGMPEAAMQRVAVDHCVRIAELAPLLLRLALRRRAASGEPGAAWTGVHPLREREMLLRRFASFNLSLGDRAQAQAGLAAADRLAEARAEGPDRGVRETARGPAPGG